MLGRQGLMVFRVLGAHRDVQMPPVAIVQWLRSGSAYSRSFCLWWVRSAKMKPHSSQIQPEKILVPAGECVMCDVDVMSDVAGGRRKSDFRPPTTLESQ